MSQGMTQRPLPNPNPPKNKNCSRQREACSRAVNQASTPAHRTFQRRLEGETSRRPQAVRSASGDEAAHHQGVQDLPPPLCTAIPTIISETRNDTIEHATTTPRHSTGGRKRETSSRNYVCRRVSWLQQAKP